MMKCRILLLLSLLFFSSSLYAQSGEEYTVEGVVVDESGITLPGVNVYNRDTKVGAKTDFMGKFKLKLQGDVTLVFSYIGMKTKRVEVHPTDITNNDLQITLKEDLEMLDEIVVVGYGSQNASDMTGSVSQLKENEDITRQYTNVDEVLQGRMAGVQVTTNSGQPGGGVSVKIRGVNSLRGNNEPLYIVDGMVISSAGEDTNNAFSDGNEDQGVQNGLAGINPRDIASIEVLKDASATAIYGSRGANGVVLITTKQGAKGKTKINAYLSTEMAMISNKVDVLNSVEFAQMSNEVRLRKGFFPQYHIDNGQIYQIKDGIVDSEALVQVNWQDEIYQPGVSTTAQLSASGGTDKSKFYISGSFNDLNGIVQNSNMKTGDLRLNFQTNVTDKLKIDTRMSMFYSQGQFAQGGSKGGSSRSFTKSVVNFQPIYGQEDDVSDIGLGSPVAFLQDYEDLSNELKLFAAFNATYSISKSFKYQLRANTNYRTKERSIWYGRETQKGSQVNGALGIAGMDRTGYVIDNLLMFNKKINKKHRIDAVVGFIVDGVVTTQSNSESENFPVHNLKSRAPQLGQTIVRPYTSIQSEEFLLSGLGRFTYTYDNRYTVTATMRADGSSKFRAENQFGYFPSAAAAWHISEESFLNTSEAVSNLKLRASWGLTGNQAINPYQTMTNFGVVYYTDANNNQIIGAGPNNLGNEFLRWETTTQANVGLDFGFLQGKIYGSVDVFHKRTDDLLQAIQLPPSTGFQSYLTNRGSIENKGIDFMLETVAYAKKDWNITLGGNISVVRTNVLDLGIPEAPVYINGEQQMASYYLGNNVSSGTYFKQPSNIFMVGQQVGMFWGYKTDGVYQTAEEAANGTKVNGQTPSAGDIRFVDQNGDGNIDNDDLTIIGNPNPWFTFGFNAKVSYKNLTVSALFTGAIGQEIANGNLLIESDADQNNKNIRPDAYYNAWREGSTNATAPRLAHPDASLFTDRIIERGDYLRLSNLTVGYDVPISSRSVERLNIFFAARNLFTITNYSGYDPELTTFMGDGTIMNVDWNSFPNARSFTLGANITF
ncbi:SusC/RagA family TonB-linked outer membrane protein [Flammeovirga yaeyamensis]|uniref:SusC/RagA family TonB-linked outer membrane protein n=1 Tax=Flammeovirga yaeyamensis TaxID=367791 RepID=A0AAX1NB80_9BACT|nr:TonB-dependent receptor [Flammeovirga yaeyamensis]MBB3697297.1 TonB-linked SusC/RagA family outer membrane protein [Flammeovirga yaeyamensis]NMF33954.1 TonB-dependent receptor [Flammeovirga yaeyamensis]QWG04786.1 SusC/RagA family TonB-linked outer membrane protein [Flammeovirga yaeyamensis]